MIYLLAIALSLIFCIQFVVLECTRGNIVHVQNGRAPNAGVALFPIVPVTQVVACGGAWIARVVIPDYAIWAMIGCMLAITAVWLRAFLKVNSDYKRVVAIAKQNGTFHLDAK